MQNEEDFQLREYLTIILKRKRIVLAVFIITLVISLLVSLRATPLYTAATRLKVEQKSGNPLDNIYSGARYGPVFYNSQIQIISSPSVMEKVVTLLDLTNTYNHYFPEINRRSSAIRFFKGFFNSSTVTDAAGHQVTEEPGQGLSVQILAKKLLGNLRIVRIRDSQILRLSYTSSNPVFSSLICNTLPRAYIEQLLEMKMINSQYAIDWMEKKATTEREKLEEAEHSMQNYLVSQDIITIENRIAIIPERLSQISSQATKAEARQTELESIVEQIDNTPWDSLDSIPVIADEESLQAIRSQIRAAEQDILSLRQKYGALHPVRIQAKNTLKELKTKN